MRLSGRLRRRDRRGQHFTGIVFIVMLASALMIAVMGVAQRAIHDRTERERAISAISRQFTRVEQAVHSSARSGLLIIASGDSLSEGDAAGNPVPGTHGGWDDDAPSAWSEWYFEPQQPCNFEIQDSCWQFRFGDIFDRAIRGGIIRPEREVYVRAIAGCDRTSIAPTLLSGARRPEADTSHADLLGACEAVEITRHRYRQRGFMQYGLHFDVQAVSPRQALSGTSDEVVLDDTLDLTIGSSSIPIHTNESVYHVCGLPQLGNRAEVSVPTSQQSYTVPLPLPDALEVADASCPTVAAFAALPSPNTEIFGSSELQVSLIATEPAAAGRCAAAVPQAPSWMSVARELARQTAADHSIAAILAHNGRFDLAGADDGYVIYGVGDLEVTGTVALHAAVTVVAAGDLTIIGTPDAGSPVGSTGLVALIAGCDVLIEDPGAASLSGPTHDVTLRRVAILAPSGALYPVAADTAADISAPATVRLIGSAATGYWGDFGLIDVGAAQQISGYGFDIDYPADWASQQPPWWPDPLGGAWQPVT